jgi:hypothetical protein
MFAQLLLACSTLTDGGSEKSYDLGSLTFDLAPSRKSAESPAQLPSP